MLLVFQQQWVEKYNSEINYQNRNINHIVVFREFKKIKSNNKNSK